MTSVTRRVFFGRLAGLAAGIVSVVTGKSQVVPLAEQLSVTMTWWEAPINPIGSNTTRMDEGVYLIASDGVVYRNSMPISVGDMNGYLA